MIKIKVKLKEKSHLILIGSNIIDKIDSEVKKHVKGKKIIVITDDVVNELYANRLIETLIKNGFYTCLTVIPHGEKSKNIDEVKKVYEKCIKNKMHRDSCIIALGGGVVTDLAGFVAATYMRGINLINIPTTLVGQVDAAIGGKTGVNFKAKNIIGSFYQPKLVLIDINFLKTLLEKEMKNGLAEIIKYAIIKDAKLFRFLERNKQKIMELDKNSLLTVISRCCLIKARIVEIDEKENNVRAILNYGHTIGHAIERVSNYKVSHGRGVAMGMIIEAKIARLLNLLSERQEKRIMQLIKRYDLIGDMHLKKKSILKTIGLDKKILNEKIRFVLPIKIGKVGIANVPVEIIERALEL